MSRTAPPSSPSAPVGSRDSHEPNVAIVGVGLIGGSIAAALRARGYEGRIIGVGRSRTRLEQAQAAGLIDEIATECPSATFFVYCLPVDRIGPQIIADAPSMSPGTVVTDGGSVKAAIRDDVAGRLPTGVTFIGSHPLAGSEKTGFEHADPDLYVDRDCVVTPEKATPLGDLDRVRAFWRLLGMRIVELDAEEHDRILAMTSHVPHVLAALLAGSLADSERSYTATGFRDTTRIAAGDPAIWVPILVANREAVLEGLARTNRRIDRFHEALANGDAVELARLLAEGKRVRDSLDGAANSTDAH